MEIKLYQAEQEDMAWVNTQYEEIKFMPSEFESEEIWIATANGVKAGLGRLVHINEGNWELGGIYVLDNFRGAGIARKIVQKLCDIGQQKNENIWCVPFNHLTSFYQSFGLNTYDPGMGNVPDDVLKKINYCESTYTQKVELLKLKS